MLAGQVLRLTAGVKKLSDVQINVQTTNVVSNEEISNQHWDYTNFLNALTVMSLPSPNGSNSSIISSEDSSSTTSTHSSIAHQKYFLQANIPTTSSGCGPSYEGVGGSGKSIKLCRVCGDRAKSYHFGGISCDSCKAFFRRSVQNDAYRNFNCPYEGHCDINMTSRKCCQFCRFHKCLSIGMEKSWVMTEEERLQMLKSRMNKKKQKESENVLRPCLNNSSSTSYTPDFKMINYYLSNHEIKIVENIMNLYHDCERKINLQTNNANSNKTQKTRPEILNIFFSAIQRFALFAKSFDSFIKINQHDQEILLRGGVLELCFIRSAFSYEKKSKCWNDLLTNLSILKSDDLSILMTKNLIEKHLNFINNFQKLKLDEPSIMLLSVIVLLTPDRNGLNNTDLIQNEQEKYLILLKNYMNWRYGIKKSTLLYPKLLLKLIDIRELAESHTDYQLVLGKDELNEIQYKLSNLYIDSNQLNHNKNNHHTPIASLTTSWSITNSIQQINNNLKIYNEEDLSTSSEGSEKLSSD